MKKILLILSRCFPIYHPRRGQETHFAENLGDTKIHTIRAGYDRWKHNLEKAQRGDFVLSVRQWTGNPYNSSQQEIARFTGSQIGYQRISMTYDAVSDELKVVIDGKRYTDLETLAHNDGLSLADFKAFLFGADKTARVQLFQGIIIHFTEFRY